MRALLLVVGERTCAVPLTAARQVVHRPHLTDLPGASSPVLGVCNVRGEVVPTFDLGALLGVTAQHEFTHVVVVDTDRGPAGLAVTAPGDILVLGERVEGDQDTGDRVVHEVEGHAVHTTVQLLDAATLLYNAAEVG
jgi:chemotaxis signal transduction protein